MKTSRDHLYDIGVRNQIRAAWLSDRKLIPTIISNRFQVVLNKELTCSEHVMKTTGGDVTFFATPRNHRHFLIFKEIFNTKKCWLLSINDVQNLLRTFKGNY